jgi:hypothetical protein
MPTLKTTTPLKALQVTRFYVVVPSDATSEKVIDSIESAQNAALAFVNARSLPVAAVETTQINGVVCCSVWYRANGPIDPAAPVPVATKPKAAKPKPTKPVKSDSSSSSSSASSSVSPSPSPSPAPEPAPDSVALDLADSAGNYSFAPAEGDIELKERVSNNDKPAPVAAATPAKKKKPTLVVPAKYSHSTLRVGMKNVVLNAGDAGDSASVQLICHLADVTTEHTFIAKKTTLAALGYADMEEGTVNIKELVLLSLHYIVDDAKSQLRDIPRQLSPEQLHELFPAYTKSVAKPGSQAASAEGCTIQ